MSWLTEAGKGRMGACQNPAFGGAFQTAELPQIWESDYCVSDSLCLWSNSVEVPWSVDLDPGMWRLSQRTDQNFQRHASGLGDVLRALATNGVAALEQGVLRLRESEQFSGFVLGEPERRSPFA